MSKRRKRLELIRQNPKDVSFDALQQVLIDCGFNLERSSGSHHIFKVVVGDEIITLTIPFARPVKPVYVKDVLEIIDKIEARSDDTEDADESTSEES